MQAALYLIPVTLGDTPHFRVLPGYNRDIIVGIRHFIVENVRSARRFLSAVDKDIDMESLVFFELNGHTDVRAVEPYLEPLAAGQPMGVISEAGCPAVADPGALVVAMAHRRGFPVVPLVGPSSIIMAVMASGMNGQSFAFNGYLPVKDGERTRRIRQLEERAWREGQTQLFIEAPYRNLQLFRALLSACRKDTLLCVAAGLTTAQEYIRTRTVAGWKKEGEPPVQKVPAIFLLHSAASGREG